MLKHDVSKLPKWAQDKINGLERYIQETEAIRQMHDILIDKERDWFNLTGSLNGCTEESLSLWILDNNQPFRVCTLYREDLLFIGRANKRRHGFKLVNNPLMETVK
jgi:hypothetical protein